MQLLLLLICELVPSLLTMLLVVALLLFVLLAAAICGVWVFGCWCHVSSGTFLPFFVVIYHV